MVVHPKAGVARLEGLAAAARASARNGEAKAYGDAEALTGGLHKTV